MNKTKQIKTFFLAALTLVFFSCSKNEKEISIPDNMDLNIQEISAETADTADKTFIHYNSGDDKVICVLFGYGFTKNETYYRTDKMLREKFGYVQDGGLIVPVIFPDDLKNRIMNLTDIANSYNLGGIILLGAPENTHYTIARIQDNWEQNCPFDVFSFFPQDDILGEEATCTFVLDNEHPVSNEEPLEEHVLTIDKSFDAILESAIKYMISLPGNLPNDKSLESHVQNIIGSAGYKHFTDSETGLQSSNHFVLTGKN